MKYMMLLLPLIYISGNGYLFLRTWQAMSGLPIWAKVLITILFWAIAFSLFVAIGLREAQIPEVVSRTMFRLGAVWMVFLLYMVLTLTILDIAKIWIPAIKTPLFYALPLVFALLTYGYINYKNPKVEHFDVSLNKDFEGKTVKIASVSDVHLGYGTGVSDLEKYVELINAQNPDIILISGDLIDNSIKPLLKAPFDKSLSKLKAPLGIYMVLGNHEYISGLDKCTDYLRNTSIKILRDTVVTFPSGIQLVGRDDKSNKRRKPLADLLRMVDKNKPVIVLDHQPHKISEADSLGVDLLLCGHTHHGQVWPMSLITDYIYEQSHGYRKWNHTHVWVSSGISLWGPPFRIGTNSDMAVFEIK